MGIDETEPATAHLNVDRAPAAKDVYADRQGHPGDEVSALRIRRSEMPRRQVRTHQDHVAVGEPQVIKRARAGHKGYFDVDILNLRGYRVMAASTLQREQEDRQIVQFDLRGRHRAADSRINGGLPPG